MAKISPDDLLREARLRTGLTDFGGGEPFLHDFRRFVSALDTDDIRPGREPSAREYLLNLLVNRLWFEHDRAQHPEIDEEQLLPPVAIVSLPRSGTTKLQRLLGETGRFHNLYYWQVHNFARVPGQADGGKAQRLQQATGFLDWLASVEPQFLQTHPMVADEVEEEFLLMEASFRSHMLASVFDAPDYAAWFATADLAPTYDYLVDQLRYVQWQYKIDGAAPRPWLLKSPGLLGLENQLERVFPSGFRMITTHRHPLDLMPSNALTAQVMHFFGRHLDNRLVGRWMIAWFGSAIRSYVDWRQRNTTVPVLDLGFDEITRDSIGTARKACEFLDIPLTDDVIARIREWDVRNPRDRFGRHEATLAQYGFDPDELNAVFKPYLDAFSHYLTHGHRS